LVMIADYLKPFLRRPKPPTVLTLKSPLDDLPAITIKVEEPDDHRAEKEVKESDKTSWAKWFPPGVLARPSGVAPAALQKLTPADQDLYCGGLSAMPAVGDLFPSDHVTFRIIFLLRET
jgi:hypothetical protein